MFVTLNDTCWESDENHGPGQGIILPDRGSYNVQTVTREEIIGEERWRLYASTIIPQENLVEEC
jgi:hypothetical protein